MMNDYDSADDTNYVCACVCVCVCGRNEARKWRKATKRERIPVQHGNQCNMFQYNLKQNSVKL